MRDRDRIKPILELVERIWLDNPDLRLGQLLLNCFDSESSAYNLDDEYLILKLEKTYLRDLNE